MMDGSAAEQEEIMAIQRANWDDLAYWYTEIGENGVGQTSYRHVFKTHTRIRQES